MPQPSFNVQVLLQDFNPSKFIVYSCLLIFTILLSLKLDNKIGLSYWLVFTPLWIWKCIAILGALVGAEIWLRHPEYRNSTSSYIHFKSMLISVSLQMLLLMCELLACDKLESGRHTWTFVFIPLIFASLLSILVCVWSIKNGRSIELEFFAAINILQFILVALKLDNLITWFWIVVFVPTWIILCFAIFILLYTMIFFAVSLNSPETGSEQRRHSLQTASASSIIYLPILLFMILLTSKLDSPPDVLPPSYLFTCLPLFVTLMILIRMSFGSKLGSLWWFGIRTDFCTFLLKVCPCLKAYGNTSFTLSSPFSDTVEDSTNIATIAADISANYLRETSGARTDIVSGGDPSPSSPIDNEAKNFFHSISRAFSRDKTIRSKADNSNHESANFKLNIDSPD